MDMLHQQYYMSNGGDTYLLNMSLKRFSCYKHAVLCGLNVMPSWLHQPITA